MAQTKPHLVYFINKTNKTDFHLVSFISGPTLFQSRVMMILPILKDTVHELGKHRFTIMHIFPGYSFVDENNP